MYYINLERSKGRRFYIEKEFKRHNLKVKRLNAIDAKKINIQSPKYDKYLKNNKKIYYNNEMIHYFLKNPDKQGHFECYLSHLKAMKNFLKTDKEFLIIYEDDVILIDNYKDLLIERTKYVPNDRDMILLGFITPVTDIDKWNYKKIIRMIINL